MGQLASVGCEVDKEDDFSGNVLGVTNTAVSGGEAADLQHQDQHPPVLW